ncbi:sigma-54 interaction domain-containing protein [Pseudalkalibacillus decolorationis]|uniref:sigma-54 interaction domain-containing protein n=1 Tax=Pseudalkalibacillus decolorationis TaxID=163879 RepID=UPI0021482EDD|nr:sigma 54-interacting transcriptional regulator [Pseudalkalibacillus decolorationis]
MISMEMSKPIIEQLLVGASNILKIDAAIINANGQLFISTQRYEMRKGKTVHFPSIKTAFDQGSFLVDRPGHMDSCSGCRFNLDCPAKIELLNSIKVDNQSLGVISLTSFTKEGRHRLAKYKDEYIQFLNGLTELIVSIVKQEEQNHQLSNVLKVFKESLNISTEALLICDSHGKINHCNQKAQVWLNDLNLKSNSLITYIPNDVLKLLQKGHDIHDIYIEKFKASLTSSPIKNNNSIIGFVFRINNSSRNNKRYLERSRLFSLDAIKGESTQIIDLKNKIERIKNSTSTVLFTGETGTGKSIIAKAIHYSSIHSNGSFIPLNCASIPESLFESELYGYEDGAFTGAKKGGKKGYFELAEGGTLFLDEIGDMPFHLQAKLLKVLQDGSIFRVGGTRSISTNVRIIAATNQNLEQLIDNGKFRADLYYRLNVIPFHLPPLRIRKNDIELLANEFLRKFHVKTGKKINSFSNEVMEILTDYDWPGNIRELENVVEYALNLETSNQITLESLPDRLLKPSEEGIQNSQLNLEELEKDMIKNTLDKYGYNYKGKALSAQELGIGIRTLYRRIKKYSILESKK